MRCLAMVLLCLSGSASPQTVATDRDVQSATDVEEPRSKPNVLFLSIDDLNDWVGFLGGHEQTHPPNLDRLAKRGLLFTRAYCDAPLCNPSRVSVMTGVRPSTSGVYQNGQPLRRALPDAVTLPQLFRREGYRVQGGGKLFHGAWPDPPSWDAYFPSQEINRPADPLPEVVPRNGPTSAGDWAALDLEDGEFSDGKVARWAVERLEEGLEEPFFLGVGIFLPHLPWYAPEAHFDRFPTDGVQLPRILEDDLADVPPPGRVRAKQDQHQWMLDEGKWHAAVGAYLASVSFADSQVGLVLDALEASPFADNTIIVLWSDHGFHLGEKSHWRKKTLWEEATRVPLILLDPRQEEGGGQCDRPVSLVDLYPTLIELCGLDASEMQELEGLSFVPLLDNPEAPRQRPALTTLGPGHHAVRTERWRYIRYRNGSEELYDHDSDPDEWHNLAGDAKYAETIEGLRSWLPKEDAPHAPREEQRFPGRRR